MLRDRGHDVIELPARRLVPTDAAAAWADGLERDFDWVVFVSPGAIDVALGALQRPWPARVGIAVVGPGSALALGRHPAIGSDVRVVRPESEPFDASALLRTPPFDAPVGLRVLVVRGESGRDDWIATLGRRGARVETLGLYRAVAAGIAPQASSELAGWAADGQAAVFAFTAADAVAHVDHVLGDGSARKWARAQPALSQHPRISEALRSVGWKHVIPIEPGDCGLIAGIESSLPQPPAASPART